MKPLLAGSLIAACLAVHVIAVAPSIAAEGPLTIVELRLEDVGVMDPLTGTADFQLGNETLTHEFAATPSSPLSLHARFLVSEPADTFRLELRRTDGVSLLLIQGEFADDKLLANETYVDRSLLLEEEGAAFQIVTGAVSGVIDVEVRYRNTSAAQTHQATVLVDQDGDGELDRPGTSLAVNGTGARATLEITEAPPVMEVRIAVVDPQGRTYAVGGNLDWLTGQVAGSAQSPDDGWGAVLAGLTIKPTRTTGATVYGLPNVALVKQVTVGHEIEPQNAVATTYDITTPNGDASHETLEPADVPVQAGETPIPGGSATNWWPVVGALAATVTVTVAVLGAIWTTRRARRVKELEDVVLGR